MSVIIIIVIYDIIFLFLIPPSEYLFIHSFNIYWRQTNMIGTGDHMEKKIESVVLPGEFQGQRSLADYSP